MNPSDAKVLTSLVTALALNELLLVPAELTLPAAVETEASIASTSTWRRRKARLMRVTLQELTIKIHLKNKSQVLPNTKYQDVWMDNYLILRYDEIMSS